MWEQLEGNFLLLVTLEKRLTHIWLQAHFRGLKRTVRSLLSLLFSRGRNMPISLSSSSSDVCSKPYPNAVALPSVPAPQCLSYIEEPRTELSTHSRCSLPRYMYFYMCVYDPYCTYCFLKVKTKIGKCLGKKMRVKYALADFCLTYYFVLRIYRYVILNVCKKPSILSAPYIINTVFYSINNAECSIESRYKRTLGMYKKISVTWIFSFIKTQNCHPDCGFWISRTKTFCFIWPYFGLNINKVMTLKSWKQQQGSSILPWPLWFMVCSPHRGLDTTQLKKSCSPTPEWEVAVITAFQNVCNYDSLLL